MKNGTNIYNKFFLSLILGIYIVQNNSEKNRNILLHDRLLLFGALFFYTVV